MTLRDRFLAWRDRRLTNPKFQTWAASVPFVRGLARKRARQAFDLCAGFVYSQVLQACIQLGVLEEVRDEPLDLGELAIRLDFPKEGLERLLKAAIALDLLMLRSGGRFGLGETGAALLGNPGVFSMVRHHATLYQDLTDPIALLRERRTDTALAQYWAYAGQATPQNAKPNAVEAYSHLMAQTQTFIASTILDAVSFSEASHLMDVGGGLGAFVAHAGQRYAGLALTVCDLPGVVSLADDHLAKALPDRDVNLVGVNMFEDALPKTADTISLIRILHDHDDAPVETLLKNVRSALPPGGRLVIAEPMAETPGAEAMGDAYFGLYLWAMASGRPRSAGTLKAMLQRAGFGSVDEVPSAQPLLTRILIAR
ncbi:MAG: methyltransferase [Pseudomonadota bacterium]